LSKLIPNLGDLRAVLPRGSDGDEVAAVFDATELPTVRAGLRALLAGWERTPAGQEPRAGSGVGQAQP